MLIKPDFIFMYISSQKIKQLELKKLQNKLIVCLKLEAFNGLYFGFDTF
jgi:hypothetical protein